MEKKQCSRCKLCKPITDFARKNKEGTKHAAECKVCHNIIRRKYYVENTEKEKARTSVNKKKLLLWFKEYKSNLKCSRCPENHPACLEFHHLDPNLKEGNVRVILFAYGKKKFLEEVDKCEILCSNCHKKLHYDERATSVP